MKLFNYSYKRYIALMVIVLVYWTQSTTLSFIARNLHDITSTKELLLKSLTTEFFMLFILSLVLVSELTSSNKSRLVLLNKKYTQWVHWKAQRYFRWYILLASIMFIRCCIMYILWDINDFTTLTIYTLTLPLVTLFYVFFIDTVFKQIRDKAIFGFFIYTTPALVNAILRKEVITIRPLYGIEQYLKHQGVQHVLLTLFVLILLNVLTSYIKFKKTNPITI